MLGDALGRVVAERVLSELFLKVGRLQRCDRHATGVAFVAEYVSFPALCLLFRSFREKKLALVGQQLLISGLVLMMVAGGWNTRLSLPLIVASLLVSCIGGSLQGASWFALLNPIIPEGMRGRFFCRLRVIFQSVSILFTVLITRVLKSSQSMAMFQLLLGLVLVATVLRYFTYARIPELENTRGESGHRQPFLKALRAVLAVPGYIQFNGYVFLITLFTAAVPTVFGLMQKDIFGFAPDQITSVGTMVLVGGMMGCWLGGRVVDRLGIWRVFRVAHVAYVVVMLAMLTRHWAPWPLMVHVKGCVWAFSLVAGVAGVAATSQTLALIPATNKSLSTAFTMSLLCAAIAFAGMFVYRSISWGIFASEWRMLGCTFTVYDSLLLTFATLAVLMLIAIGLVRRAVAPAHV